MGRPFEEAWGDPERGKRLAAAVRGGGRAARHGSTRGPPDPRRRVEDLRGQGARPLRDAGGGDPGRVLVLEDLTELIKAQQLAAWNEAARRIAHEIKNPLTPIRLSAERLLRKHQQGDPGLGRGDRGGGARSSSARW